MIELIPAIDLINGECVRLSQGDFNSKKIYSNDPVTIAKQFEDAGIKRLHIVDLDGARAGRIANLYIVEKIARQTSLIIDMGGGVRSTQDVQSILQAGARYISIGSIAYKRPELFAQWIENHGADTFLLGADVKNEQIVIHGWTESTEQHIHHFIEHNYHLGIRQVFCTDIATDGMLQGPSFSLYEGIKSKFPQLQLIASGGVSSIQDIHHLQRIGCSGVIIGKALYEGKITLAQLQSLNTNTQPC